MDMQDNELDNLFQSALNDHEIEPSANVWTGITGHLDAGKRKKSLMPFLSIAAGVVLLLTAGILFIPKVVKINKQQPLSNRVAKSTQAANSTAANVAALNPQNKKTVNPVITPASNLAALKTIKVNKAVTINKAEKVIEPKANVAEANDQPILALATREDDLTSPVVPGTETRIMINPVTDNPPVLTDKPVLAMAQVPAANKKGVTPAKKWRIRSFGDVLNVVIAAVDKREDKFIEFTNTDEDDATITGINLGIIKVKKEK
jgi:hypothetical protein